MMKYDVQITFQNNEDAKTFIQNHAYEVLQHNKRLVLLTDITLEEVGKITYLLHDKYEVDSINLQFDNN